MFKTIKKYYAAWLFKRAVRKAKKLAGLFGMKYYVINLGGHSRSFRNRQSRNSSSASGSAKA